MMQKSQNDTGKEELIIKMKSESKKPNLGESPARVKEIVETWGSGQILDAMPS